MMLNVKRDGLYLIQLKIINLQVLDQCQLIF